MDFETWFAELKTIAVEAYGFTENVTYTFDESAWRGLYNEGLTPAQALTEDMSYA